MKKTKPGAPRKEPRSAKIKEESSVHGALSAFVGNDEEEKPAKSNAKFDDLNEEDLTMLQKFRRCLKPHLDVESDNFNFIIGLVIVANAITIGFETDYGRQNFIVLEHIFNSCFFIETCMRVYQLRMEYIYEPWNLFDLSLVITGTLDLWILPAFNAGGNDQGSAVHGLTSLRTVRLLRMIRILRLMRVLRVVRLFRMFKQLFLIMQAFSKAFQVVIIVSVFIAILIYVYSIILTQMVGHRAHEWGDDEDQILDWFGTIPASMRTMFFVMTLTEWDNIPNLLIKVLPAFPVMVGFVTYILVSSYTMVSLITGIISESLIASQQDYKHKKLIFVEENRRIVVTESMSQLSKLLKDSMNEHGKVAAEELKQSVRGDAELVMKLLDIQICISDESMALLIDGLATEEQGKQLVNVEQFVDKLCHFTGDAKGAGVVEVKQVCRDIATKVDRLEKKFDALQEGVMKTLDQLLK